MSCGSINLFLSRGSKTLPEKVISACSVKEFPVEKDKTSWPSILLPVH